VPKPRARAHGSPRHIGRLEQLPRDRAEPRI
jgi:hypothetical protein